LARACSPTRGLFQNSQFVLAYDSILGQAGGRILPEVRLAGLAFCIGHTMTQSNLDAAVRYAELGYPIFPCAPNDKRPLTANGFLDATVDPARIEAYWSDTPAANVAIATAGLLVVDIDGSANPWLTDQPEKLLERVFKWVFFVPVGVTSS
jgi:hypothetical protein